MMCADERLSKVLEVSHELAAEGLLGRSDRQGGESQRRGTVGMATSVWVRQGTALAQCIGSPRSDAPWETSCRNLLPQGSLSSPEGSLLPHSSQRSACCTFSPG